MAPVPAAVTVEGALVRRALEIADRFCKGLPPELLREMAATVAHLADQVGTLKLELSRSQDEPRDPLWLLLQSLLPPCECGEQRHGVPLLPGQLLVFDGEKWRVEDNDFKETADGDA